MNDILKDISSVSLYRPHQGDLLKLFRLIVEKEVKKEEVVQSFSSNNYFRVTYKKLKDHLLDGILLNSFKQISHVQQQHFQLQKRCLESIMLIQTGKTKAGIKVGQETLLLAEKYGLVDVVLTLSRNLETLFSTVHIDKHKRNKYKAKTLAYRRYFDQECHVQSLYSELAYCVQTNQSTEHIPAALAELKKIGVDNHQFKFRLYYYSIQSLYYRYLGDDASLVTTCKDAISFFENQPNPLLPYTTKWSFYFHLIPLYISTGSYAEAESSVNQCIELPGKGSYNWHLTLLLKVVLGFYSRKPSIAVQAYREAHSVKPLFESKLIQQRWSIVYGYLCLLHRFEVVDFPDNFRLYRFLNKSSANSSTKNNMLILELLHLIKAGKETVYMDRCETIERYIQRNLRGPKFHRPKYFLRMLKAVNTGDSHPVRVAAHAKKNFNLLRKITPDINLDLLDQEPVPYNWLWELIMDKLSKNRGRKRK